MTTAKVKLEQEVAEFFAKHHDALTTSKQKALTTMAASKGKATVDSARKAKLPLGRVLDDAVSEYSSHVAEEYTFIDPYGAVMTKQHLIQGLRSGEGIFDDLTRTQHDVRIYKDLAVSTSLVKVKGEYNDQDISGEYWETHTLQRVGSGWQLVASQATQVQKLSALLLKAADCDDAAAVFRDDVSLPGLT
jgi:hypothetical protein